MTSRSAELALAPLLTPKESREAIDLYLSGLTLKGIAERLSLPLDSLRRSSAKEGWAKWKRYSLSNVVEAFSATKRPAMAEIGSLSLDLIIDALKNRKRQAKENPVSIQEARMISDIFAAVDKIIKLDTGQATENINVQKVSIEDVREALINDRFVDLIPLDKGDADEGPMGDTAILDAPAAQAINTIDPMVDSIPQADPLETKPELLDSPSNASLEAKSQGTT